MHFSFNKRCITLGYEPCISRSLCIHRIISLKNKQEFGETRDKYFFQVIVLIPSVTHASDHKFSIHVAVRKFWENTNEIFKYNMARNSRITGPNIYMESIKFVHSITPEIDYLYKIEHLEFHKFTLPNMKV